MARLLRGATATACGTDSLGVSSGFMQGVGRLLSFGLCVFMPYRVWEK